MLRRYRFELILILLIICAVVATRFFLSKLFIPRSHFAASTSFSLK